MTIADDVTRGIQVRTLLARAYATDPLLQWIFPDPLTRPDAAAAWLGLFVERSVQVDRIGDDPLEAVAVWRHPDGAGRVMPLDTLPGTAGLLGAIIGPDRAAHVGRGLAAMRTLVPTRPHVYLQFTAVASERRSRGRGRRVLSPGLDRADHAGLGVHLETTNPEAVGFYEALGFAVSGRTRLGPDGPRLWAMWRDPRPERARRP